MKKQWVKRSITWIVTLALMLQIIPLTVLAEDGTDAGTTASSETATDKETAIEAYEAYIVEEDVSKREENVKHFRMSDGAYTAVVYDEPVHYLDNGVWKEIDNTLIRREEEGETNSYYTNKANGFAVNLPETIGALAPVIVQRGAAQLSFALQVDGSARANLAQPQDAKALAQQLEEKLQNADSETKRVKIANESKIGLPNLRSGATYASLIQGIDLDYQIHGASLKENIILHSVPTQENYVFSFTYSGLTATLKDNRSLAFYEPGEPDPVFVISAPYMEDKAGSVCCDVGVNVTETDTGCLYSITPSREWLTDEERMYPVVIDPTIETTTGVVTSNATTCNWGSNYVSWFNDPYFKQKLFIGTYMSGVSLSPLLYFPNVTLSYGNPQITSAKLSLQYDTSANNCASDLQINAQAMTGGWAKDGNFVNALNTTYISGSILDYAILSDARVANADTDVVTFDVTAAARKWYSDPSANEGLILRPAGSAGTASNYVKFYSNTYSGSGVKKPTLELTYRDMAGLEGYGSYTSMEAGRGGAVHIDNFYNNLVVEQPVAGVGGERMPVSIGIAYNESQTAAAVDTSFGVGWRCNYSMRINAYGLQGYGYYLTDEDGTDHFFVTTGGNGSSGYKDEDDLGYTLYTSFTGSSAQKFYKMTADATTLFFNSSGWLTCIEDNNGNVITVSRNSSNQITQITDGAGRHYTFSYSDGKVSYITAPDSRTAVFGYSNGYLQSIIFPGNQTVTYGMTDGQLSRINNAGGTSYVDIASGVTSDPLPTYVTRTLALKNTAGDVIDSCLLTFKDFATEAADQYGDITIHQFDLEGHETGTLNKPDYNSSYNVYGLSLGSRHKLTSSAATLVPANNLLSDSGFENGVAGFVPSGLSACLTADTNKIHTGKQAVILTKSGTGTTASYQRNITNLVSIESGRYYTVSAYVKTNGSLTGSGVRMNFQVTGTVGGDYTSENYYCTETHGEWQRISAVICLSSEASPSSGTLIIAVEMASNTTGEVYIDDVQLEEGKVVNEYNLLTDSMLTGSDSWVVPGGVNCSFTPGSPTYARIVSEAVKENYIYQDIPVSGAANDSFSFGGWGYARSVPIEQKVFAEGDPTFGITLQFKNTNDVWIDGETAMFNSAVDDWQCIVAAAVAPEAFSAIRIILHVNYNVECGRFSNVFLCSAGRTVYYTYDENGNLIESVDPDGTVTAMEYDEDDRMRSCASTDSDTRVLYSYTDDGNISSMYNTDGQYLQMIYEGCGNAVETQEYTWPPVTAPVTGTSYFLRNAATGDVLHSNGSSYTMLPWDSRVSGQTSLQYGTVGFFSGCTVTADADRSVTLCFGGLYLAAGENGAAFESAADSPYQRWYLLAENGKSAVSVKTETEYDEDTGNYATAFTNAQGKTASYTYNVSGQPVSVTSPGGFVTGYAYNTCDQLTELTQGNSKVEYVYSGNRLTDIRTFADPTPNASPTTTYHYAVDSLLRPLSVSITGRTDPLETYAYDSRSRLSQITYANGQRANYAYDSLDRIVGKGYNGNSGYYKFDYDINGNLVTVTEGLTGTATSYFLDSQRRAGGFITRKTSNGAELISERYSYDINDRLTDTDLYIDGVKQYTRGVTYGSAANGQLDGAVYGVTLNGNDSVTYTYDGFGRVTNVATALGSGTMTAAYTYKQGGYGTNSTGNQIGLKINQIGSGIYYYSYNYNDDGRISGTSEFRSGTSLSSYGRNHSYFYDACGQLIRDEITGTSVTLFTYDAAGNLLTKTVYPFSYVYWESDPLGHTKPDPTSAVTYTYGNSAWGDLLMAYDGVGIDYDASGNPTTYYNGAQFTWMGRNLNTAQVGSTTYTYRYNADGIRTQKRVGNTVATQYYLSGNTLVAEKSGNDLIVYLLDENGSYYGFTYNGTRYTYVTDLQGNVVAIVDADGVAVAGYAYDAWGNCTVSNVGSSTLGDINPIRYRGYYYDTELGLYYLQSRYYDPNTGRFISPDAVEYLGATGTVGSYNLYAYCENNPVNGVDPSGTITANVVGAIVGGIIGVVGGAFLGNWLADIIGLKGWTRWVFVGGVSLLVGATIAAIGYLVGPYVAKAWGFFKSQLANLLKTSFKSVAKLSSNDLTHIMKSKHLWNKVLKNVTEKNVEALIKEAVKKGAWDLAEDGIATITYRYMGQIIVVTGKVVDGILRVGTAYVK